MLRIPRPTVTGIWIKLAACLALILLAWPVAPVLALGSSQNPQSGAQGVQGEVAGPPPKTAPVIVVPTNGQVFTDTPITASGLCLSGLLVKVFSNHVFVGSTVCSHGSFGLKIDLFSGRNDLTAQQFDGLDQASPVSTTVTVTFNDTQFTKFGTVTILTSDYARRGADPGQTLTWPIILSGGVGPYAISVDWGDGSADQLISRQYPGAFTISHIYSAAGTYNILVRATDKNGTSGYLQVVAIINGNAAQQLGGTTHKTTTVVRVIWWPAAVGIAMSIVTFWLGRRYELAALRKRLEKSSQA